MGNTNRILDLYQRLFVAYGPQHWWPAEEPFEVIVGAILTQSAAWTNVEKAIRNLKQAGVLDPASLRALDQEELARLVFPSGYFNAKARKLKAFVFYLGENYKDDLSLLFARPLNSLRSEILGVYGVGPETADSILLYAGNKPIFVIDAYTQRLANRLGIYAGSDYHELQSLFMGNLPADVVLFNEYHALIVNHGKDYCRKKPGCERCCLQGAVCEAGGTAPFADKDFTPGS